MKLYYSPGSCSLAPHIVLEELKLSHGLDYQTVLVSSMDGSTQSREYLGINPKGRVPALDIGGQILTEAPAIMSYLAMSNPASDLVDKTPINFARTLEWMNWLSSSIHALAIAQHWRVERFSDESDSYVGIREKGSINLKDSFRLIEEKLHTAQGTWAIADRFSIVDPYLLVFFRWGNRLGEQMKRDYPVWTEHTHALLERQSLVNVLKDEGIDVWN